jgi:hypothetical protein
MIKKIPWNKGKKGLQISPMKGKHQTKEANFKNRLAHIGKRYSEETNKKKGLSGILNPMYGKHRSIELREKLSRLKKEEYKDKTKHPMYGKKWNDEQRLKKSLSQLGSKNHRWLGGISFEPYSVDWNDILKESIRQRDNHTCAICLLQQTDKTFMVHHIDYNKKNCNPNNLITLCCSCHMKTNGHREDYKKFFQTLMDIKYSGGI